MSVLDRLLRGEKGRFAGMDLPSPKINFVDRFGFDPLAPKISYGDRFGYDANLDKFENLRNMDVFKSESFKPVIGQTARRDDVKGLNLSIGDINPITGTTFTGFPKPPPPPVTTQMSGIGSMLPTQTITLPNGQTVQIPEINMEEVNANLLAAGITPQMPLPNIIPEVTTPAPAPTPPSIEIPHQGGTFDLPAPQFRTADFQDADGNGIDDRDEMSTNPNLAKTFPDLPFTGSLVTPPPVTTPTPLAPYTGSNEPDPNYIPSVIRQETGMDALTQQLLFGLDGKGGFIPGAMRAAERTFFNPDGTPRVVEERRADLTADQLAGLDLARRNVGLQDPFLRDAQSQFRQSVADVGEGIERGRALQREGLGTLQRGIGALGSRLGESENLLRGTVGGYDPTMTSRFYNPFEERVVQQTIDDVLEAGEKQDMAQRARDIMTGGQSAFGSRARLSAGERRRDLGRGLAQALGGIRSRGFSEAQQTGLGEFARQRQAERLASTGLAGLAGTRFGAAQTGAGALSNLGNIESMYGQTLGGSRVGLGGNLQGLGTATQQAGAFDVNQLLSSGGMQQAQNQAVIDAQRANQLTAQAAPLAQYQALSPFISMAPQGSFQTSTQFTTKPSPMMAGINVGLGAIGALGNMANQPRYTN